MMDALLTNQYAMTLVLAAAILGSARQADAQTTAQAQPETAVQAPSIPSLQIGTAVVDITPDELPVLINGSMTARYAEEVNTRVNARAMVVSDGKERIALVVVDSCMVPQVLLDDAKHRVATRIGIPTDKIMISATHTHTAPSAFSALGTPADPAYVPFLREKLVLAIEQAAAKLQPARIGWGSILAPDFTASRRWVRRPDRIELDPFGNPTVRANMHAARNLDDVTGPSGPEDPELAMIAFESLEGKPLAVLANFSMHYFSDKPISADYFGLFCEAMQQRISPTAPDDVFVAMSHGCSGDIWRRDYARPAVGADHTIHTYAQGLAEIAFAAYQTIDYKELETTEAPGIEMLETRLPMKYRVPDQQRLKWSQEIYDQLAGELPKTKEEIYAREQVLLNQMQQTQVVVQAIRIGKFGIVTTPCETYALTGLKFKLQSPLEKTMVIELANGADGYIPPPEQHRLGGYNTWAARSAGLEVQAEPRIVAAGLSLLEQVAHQPRRPYQEPIGVAAQAILDLAPLAFWRLSEMQGPIGKDSSGNHHHGVYEPDILFFLPGEQTGFTSPPQQGRSAHFAGGRFRWQADSLADEFSVVMSLWNGMPSDARETTGWLFSRDVDHGISLSGQHLGVGGTATRPGRLIWQQGLEGSPAIGRTTLQRWAWYQVVLIRKRDRVQVFLAGQSEPEIDISVDALPTLVPTLFVGGRSDQDSNWEGRLDEVAIFDRALSVDEVQSLPAFGH